MIGLIGAAVLVGTLTGVAFADGGNPSAFGPFDIKDSHGILVSQYQLSIDQGGVTSPLKATTAFFELGAWDTWLVAISFIAWLVDWILGLGWVTWISGPVSGLQQDFRDKLLTPLHLSSVSTQGAMGLFFAIAGTVGGFYLFRGRRGRALGEWIGSALAAVVAVGILAAPVTLFMGDQNSAAKPLQDAQRVGSDLANLAAGNKLSDNTIDTGDVAPPTPPKFGSLIVDTFVRPVHQQLNYGTVIDTDHKECVSDYDNALKKGPYTDDASEQRDALKVCDQGKLKEYAENTNWLPLIGLSQTFLFTGALLLVVLLIFSGLIVLAVVMLGWTSIKILIHAPLAILPGDTKMPLIRDLIDIGTSLLYIVTGIPLLAAAIQVMKKILASTSGVPIQVRFTGVGLIMMCTGVLVVANYVSHRRTGRSLTKRIRDKLNSKDRQSIGDRVRDWAGKPAGISRMSAASLGFATAPSVVRGGAAHPASVSRTRSALGRVAERAVSSNGAQLALGAAGVATGGTGLLVRGATKTATTAAVTGYRAGKAAPKASRKAIIAIRDAPGRTADRASQARQTYKAFRRVGGSRATTGNETRDQLLRRTAQAHNMVSRRANHLTNSRLATRLRDDAASATARVKDHVTATGGGPTTNRTDQHLRQAARDMSRPERIEAAREQRRAEIAHLAAARSVERNRRKADRVKQLVDESFYKPARQTAAEQRYRDARAAERQAAARSKNARVRADRARELIRNRQAEDNSEKAS